MSWLMWAGSIVGALLIFMFFIGIVYSKLYVKVEQGTALIKNSLRAEPSVYFSGALIIPFIHKAEFMDISIKSMEVERHSSDGLICKDNIRADIRVNFFVRVNKTEEDVLKVAQAIRCERASDKETLEELFNAKFSEALKTVGKKLEFEQLYEERASFRDQIIEVIGQDLNGYVLEDVAIDYLEQTPIEKLDANKVVDSDGIRKIKEITARNNEVSRKISADHNSRINELENDEQLRIEKKNTESKAAMLELELQRVEAEERQKRERAILLARQTAEAEMVSVEERKRTQQAQMKADGELKVLAQTVLSDEEAETKKREARLAREEEGVQRVRMLEQIAREKEVELQRIAKEKALEEEKKAIADVVRARIAVDKTVAEEEERIKEVRAVSEAERNKKVLVVEAEAQAQQALVREVKAAEVAEKTAQHKAKERIVLAEAALESSEKEAEAKKRLAEGMTAEQAAEGLARARVIEATALAEEKRGQAEARTLRETKQAEADGAEHLGFAKAKVLQAEATALRDKMAAEAEGEELIGMAKARVKETDAASEKELALIPVDVKVAEAQAIEKRGMAEAVAIRERMAAEAAGLQEKFKAMAAMDEDARAHEEFRMQLEQQKVISLQSIDANRAIAEAQAKVLGEAMKDAKFEIIGGDGQFFERFIQSMALGRSVDGVVQGSQTVQTLMKDHLNGDRNLVADIKDILANTSSQDIKNLSMASFFKHLSNNASTEQQDKLKSLVGEAVKLGLLTGDELKS